MLTPMNIWFTKNFNETINKIKTVIGWMQVISMLSWIKHKGA